MRIIERTSRSLVTAGLIIGLAGWFPQTAARAGTDTPVPVAQTPEKCCCGTEEGRCCGMSCCMTRQAPAKERDPCPNPGDSRNGQYHPPALAATAPGGSGETGGLRFGHPDRRNLRSLAEMSLQARHVRIDA